MANCLWDDYEGHGKIHLAIWQMVSMKKENGGLGVPELKNLNLSLLGYRVKRFITDKGKLWHSIMKQKYVRNVPSIFCLPHSQSSIFWKGVMCAAKAVKFGYRWKVGDGTKIRFWEDSWFGNAPLVVQFWDLFCICNQTGVTLARVWDGNEVMPTFRRTFFEDLMRKWYELSKIVTEVCYNEDGDSFVWQYESNGIYSSQSLYAIIRFRGVKPIVIPSV